MNDRAVELARESRAANDESFTCPVLQAMGEPSRINQSQCNNLTLCGFRLADCDDCIYNDAQSRSN